MLRINRKVLKPLKGYLPNDFHESVRMLTRPYIPISESMYNKIYAVGNDFFQYGEQIVTFGTADRGFALMPLQMKYATIIKWENGL